MIVCVCNRVSDREIRHQASQGCASYDELQMATGVATCCGCCDSCAREIFDDAQATHHAGTMQRVIALAAALPA